MWWWRVGDLDAGRPIEDTFQQLARWPYVEVTFSLLVLLDHDRYDAIDRALAEPWWRNAHASSRSVLAAYHILALLAAGHIADARGEYGELLERAHPQRLVEYRDIGREVRVDEQAAAGDPDGAKQSLRERSPPAAHRRLARITQTSRRSRRSCSPTPTARFGRLAAWRRAASWERSSTMTSSRSP